MTNRPYKTYYLRELKSIAEENWHSLNELKNILSEIEQRGNKDPNLEFEIELGKQIETLQEQEIIQSRETDTQQKKQYKKQGYFPWPTTNAPISKYGSSGVQFHWEGEGLLSYVGYKVGHHGESIKIRQSILDAVFHNPLPNVISNEYMNEWGARQTPQRLKKMAESIAAFTRNNKRRDADMDEAIRNWEEDLEYLYNEYYVGKFNFGWPETENIPE